MTAAFEQHSRAKDAAVLKSIAEQIASPIVTGNGKRKQMNTRQQKEWRRITDCIVRRAESGLLPVSWTKEGVAREWKDACRSAGIGVTVLSWFFWNWVMPYLIELAARWIESKRMAESRVSER